MARPAIPASDKKVRACDVYLPPAQLAHYQALAAADGRTLSAWIAHQLTKNHPVPVAPAPERFF